jgi:hypothetical protein
MDAKKKSSNLLLLESVVEIGPKTLVRPQKACPLELEQLRLMMEELCGIQKNQDFDLPPQLMGDQANPQHVASYYLCVIMYKVSGRFNRLETNQNWVSLYMRLVEIAKVRDLDIYFQDSNTFDHLTPDCPPELRHKVFSLFSLLYPCGKIALLDGIGRVFSSTHSLTRVRFPIDEPEYGYASIHPGVGDGKIHCPVPWYPPGGDKYLKATAVTCILNLISMGVENFDRKLGVACVNESNHIQKKQTQNRPQTMNDWLQLLLSNLMVNGTMSTFKRTDKVHSRFIGDYDDLVERNNILLNNIQKPTGDGSKELIVKFGAFKETKTKKILQPKTFYPKTDGLDGWIDQVQDYKQSSSTLRLDQVPIGACLLLPYLDSTPTVSTFCPGLTYNEWMGYTGSLMSRIMTLAFIIKSWYIENSLVSFYKQTKSVEEITWAYAVGLTNRFMLEFEIKHHLYKPTWKMQWVQLFYLIASCCVRNHSFRDLRPERVKRIDVIAMLKQLFRSAGVGTFSPKSGEGKLLSDDDYVMGPLKLASNKKRELNKFEVRFAGVPLEGWV